MSLAVCRSLPDLRAQISVWRARGERIALVPTMGALHAGHLALIEAARKAAKRTILTIFVNPTQFAPNEDFSAYPRTFAADCAKAEIAKVDLVYAPEHSTMYADDFATTITVGGPALAGLEDRFRPTHFSGVATIVAKLFQQAQPGIAFFGEKDFQQLRVVERMTRDLDLPVAVRGVPTVREHDGLALSSRNVYLDTDERERAPILYRALTACARAIREGESAESSVDAARATLADSGFVIDYLEARHDVTLAPLSAAIVQEGRILTAARLGRTRLIDNVRID